MTDKSAYRTPAEAPEPEWKELTSFEVEVDTLSRENVRLFTPGKDSVGRFHSSLITHDKVAREKLRPGQRVRVVLQVLK